MNKHERIARYEESYLGDYGFEEVLVSARQRMVLDVLTQARPQVVVEVGCGIDLLGERVAEAGIPVQQWIVVEPGERFAAAAQNMRMPGTRVDVIRAFFEEAADAIAERCVRPPDFILCSGLLNEIEYPAAFLKVARGLLRAPGIAHVNVPNAFSLHRRLARAMGLIAREHQLTARNELLAQFRVFDLESLGSLARAAGFRVREQGGYFLKPFTHAQMESLGTMLSAEMLDGLWQLGRELPELASEIYVNLEPA